MNSLLTKSHENSNVEFGTNLYAHLPKCTHICEDSCNVNYCKNRTKIKKCSNNCPTKRLLKTGFARGLSVFLMRP